MTQVTDVTLVKSYETGTERQIQGADVTAVHRYEYNGLGYGGEAKVKEHDCSTEFFVPTTHVIPQVGDILAFEYVTVSQGETQTLPALPLIDAQAALNGGDTTDTEPEDTADTQEDE